MKPIEIDLRGLKKQFGLSSDSIDDLTEACVQLVTSSIYSNWEALAKQKLNSSRTEYLRNLQVVDKGRFAKQIVLTGVVPTMIESGASAFDMKNGFSKSRKVTKTPPVYDKKGNLIKEEGWYLTIPFRIGVPGTLGQAGFTEEMPNEIYSLMVNRGSNVSLKKSEIPSPYDALRVRGDIYEDGQLAFGQYMHKHSIYEGLVKHTAAYDKTTQNTYGTFRRAGSNSDPLSWIHSGISGRNLAIEAVSKTNVDLIVENTVMKYLDTIL